MNILFIYSDVTKAGMMDSAPRAVRNIVDYFVYFATILFIYSDVTKAGMMDSAPRAVRNVEVSHLRDHVLFVTESVKWCGIVTLKWWEGI